MEDCITCGIFEQLDGLARSYAQDAFASLAVWTTRLFQAFIGLWAAYELAYKASVRGELDARQFIGQLMVFVFCTAALQSSGFFFDWVYDPLQTTMSGLTQMLVSVPSTGVDDVSYKGLLLTVEMEVRGILAFALALIGQAGLQSGLLPFVAGLVIAIPYVFVWAIFLAFLLEGTFKLLGVGAVGPLLIVCAAFKPSRAFAYSGFRIALNGVLTVVFAGVAMGFTLAVMRSFVAKLPFDGQDFTGSLDAFLRGEDFYGILLIGFISILFHLKASTLASNLSGASDGPGAAATVAGLGLAGVGAVKMAGMATARKAGGMGAGTAKSIAAAKLTDAMQDSSSIKAQILRRITRTR